MTPRKPLDARPIKVATYALARGTHGVDAQPSRRSGVWAAHKAVACDAWRGYVLTHVPSGAMLQSFMRRRDAHRALDTLGDLFPKAFSSAPFAPPNAWWNATHRARTLRKIRAALRALEGE